MPELPEVEVLRNHLQGVLPGRKIRRAQIARPRTCRPATRGQWASAVEGRRFVRIERRGKYLVWVLTPRPGESGPLRVLAHLGMTGRIYLLPRTVPPPEHTAAQLTLDRGVLIFEDSRYFGRLALDLSPLRRLGPEPLDGNFSFLGLWKTLRRSRQPVKVRLLDQTVVAGVGNIYASEALFRAGIHPRTPAHRLTAAQTRTLRDALRTVLREAIERGSTVPLNWSGADARDRLFYYGTAPEAAGSYQERLRVYNRAGQPCRRCQTSIRRITQAGRSTFFCPACQPR